MEQIITTCPLDCPDNCGIIAQVKAGRVVSLKGNPEHGHTKGFLCRKGYRYPQRVYSRNRVLYPQQKIGDKWKRISWDEALDLTATNIKRYQQEYGNASIMHYQRSASWGATKHLVKRFFNLLGEITTQTGSLCAGSVMAAQKADMGARLGNDPQDIVNSKMIIIWGKDPCKTSIHTLPLLKEARSRGAYIIVIDPVRTATATISDQHIAPRPGSDGYLAIGMAKKLLELNLIDSLFLSRFTKGSEKYFSVINAVSEEKIARKTDIPPATIEQLARRYGEDKPSAIILVYGINKWMQSPEMIRLIDALGAITGNFGIQGGGVNHGFQTQRHFAAEVITPKPQHVNRKIPEPLLGQGILEADNPPIKMMWINGTNPVASCPNSNKVIAALKTLDFIVVTDHFMTDTADLAHLFLPATTFLEEEDIVVSWGHNWIGPVNQVIAPLGEARSDLLIVQELSKKLGLENEMAGTPGEWLKRLLRPMEQSGFLVENVMQSPARCPIAPAVAFSDKKFLTPSGKYEFINHLYTESKPEYPFHLLSVLGKTWLNSLILEEEHPDMPTAWIHSEVASEKGFSENQRALLKSSAGELVVKTRISQAVRPDTILIYQGTWIKKGGGVNRLTQDRVSSMGGMAAYYNTYAAIEPLIP